MLIVPGTYMSMHLCLGSLLIQKVQFEWHDLGSLPKVSFKDYDFLQNRFIIIVRKSAAFDYHGNYKGEPYFHMVSFPTS